MIIGYDIDGTIIRDDQTFSDYTKETLKLLKDKGHVLVTCTGRAYPVLPDTLKIYSDYALLCNGALLYDIKNKTSESLKSINLKIVYEILDITKDLDVDIDYFSSDKIYSDEYTYDNIEKYVDNNPNTAAMVRKCRTKVKDPLKECLDNNLDIIKINIFVSKGIDKQELMDKLNKLDLEISSSLKTNIEITAKGCNKGTGLLYLANKLNLDYKDIMMCGDASNDIPALKVAGVSVVLKNGLDVAKGYADYITKYDNNHDGLAKFFKEYFKLDF